MKELVLCPQYYFRFVIQFTQSPINTTKHSIENIKELQTLPNPLSHPSTRNTLPEKLQREEEGLLHEGMALLHGQIKPWVLQNWPRAPLFCVTIKKNIQSFLGTQIKQLHLIRKSHRCQFSIYGIKNTEHTSFWLF